VATTWPNRHDLDATLTLSSLPKEVSFGDDDRSFDFTTAVQAVAWLAQFSAQRRSSWIAEFSVSDIRTARIRYASGKNLEIKRYRIAFLVLDPAERGGGSRSQEQAGPQVDSSRALRQKRAENESSNSRCDALREVHGRT
jgi:hypothetical protein